MRITRPGAWGNRWRFPLLAVFAVLALAYAAGFYVYSYQPRQPAPVAANADPAGFDLFWEAWGSVRAEFYGQLPDSRKLAYGALHGALETLDDPYTLFLEPQPHEIEKADLHGTFGGIGVSISRDATGRVHLHPTPDSPAARAGIDDGDVLLAVDGVPLTPTLKLEEIIAWLRGPVGEPVGLSLQRAADGRVEGVSVVRVEIELPSVTWRRLEEDPTIGYIAISRFSERTDAEVRQALRDLREDGIRRLVLDLRNNGGGLLQSAVDVTGEFLSNSVVLYEERRKQREETRRTGSGGLATDVPLAVLVNRGTASAAEIVAGALQDHSRAVLIGEQTFGKGSVQLIFELSDGSSLHVTAARWETPERHRLDGVGLTPDIIQANDAEEMGSPGDAQLARAVDHLQSQ